MTEMPDTIYIGYMGLEVVTDKLGQKWPATYLKPRDSTTKYHHDRVVTALQEENKRLRGERKGLAIIVRCQWDNEDQLDAGRDLAKRILEEK